MARKTFISYKYSDVVEGKDNNLRDRIIKNSEMIPGFIVGKMDILMIYRHFLLLL